MHMPVTGHGDSVMHITVIDNSDYVISVTVSRANADKVSCGTV